MTNGKSDAPVFYPGGKQHERLGIPKAGLPALADAEFENLLLYLWRYEEALGIGGPGDPNEAESAAVLARIIADRCNVPLDEACEILARTVDKHRSGRGLEDNDHGPTVIWQPSDALAFVSRLSGVSPSVVATFLYVHQSDELAEGLFEPEDPEDWIRDTYKWALQYQPQTLTEDLRKCSGETRFFVADGQHRLLVPLRKLGQAANTRTTRRRRPR
jgi:hypothetical protein